MRKTFAILVFLSVLVACAEKAEYDVIIAGGGTGGCCAAIQAARQGCDVLLLEESDWIGGQMSSAGVGSMDEGTLRIRNYGIYREFCSRVSDYYASLGLINNLCYWSERGFSVEPAVAQKLLYDMIEETNKTGAGHIDVKLLSRVSSVKSEGNTVTGVSVSTGIDRSSISDYSCKILVDATEYGDVIPLADADYYIAKHTRDNVEGKSPLQYNTWTAILREYENGIPDELRVKEKPAGYEEYEWLFSYIKKESIDPYRVYANPTSWNSVAYYRAMPDSSNPGVNPDRTVKTQLNIAQNDVEVTVNDVVDPDARFRKETQMRARTLGLLYYVQNVLGLNWSVDTAEGYDTPYNRANIDRIIEADSSFASSRGVLVHFPVMPYVRESRRIKGLHTLISSEISRIKGPVAFPDAVVVNVYPEDLHGSDEAENLDLDIDPEAADHNVLNEWNSRIGEFQIPLRSFIPESIDGFLAAEKNISQSRLVNGATRLQPSTMNNGQLVGNLAALAVKYGKQPRQIPSILVQWEQVKAGSPLWLRPIDDIQMGKESWNYAQIALARGLFSLSGSCFFPEMPVSGDELSGMVEKFSLQDEVGQDGQVSRISLAKLIIDKEIKQAEKTIK